MKKIALILFSVLCMCSVSAQKYTDQYLLDASKIADEWLININNNQYEVAYMGLSSEIKATYKKEAWCNLMNELIIEFGGLISRNSVEKRFQSEIDGMENGFYVFIDYETDYSNTSKHNEHILLKQNDKNKWEIIDYNYDFSKK
tara:strand:- start:924 stop:1355 length:432 start_codon:yes stop_codon:yes gene_type:complete